MLFLDLSRPAYAVSHLEDLERKLVMFTSQRVSLSHDLGVLGIHFVECITRQHREPLPLIVPRPILSHALIEIYETNSFTSQQEENISVNVLDFVHRE